MGFIISFQISNFYFNLTYFYRLVSLVMGGICGKPSSAVDQGRESPKVRQVNKGAVV